MESSDLLCPGRRRGGAEIHVEYGEGRAVARSESEAESIALKERREGGFGDSVR